MSKKNSVVEEKIFIDFEKLSKKRKREAADFIAYLRVKEELEVTKELINDEVLLESIMRGDEDFKEGRFKNWNEVREDV
ncbi:MAG: hypothetical protein HQ591_04065 [candidate division Zixibacteria bacterium]|nr:hypothetical protein [Candidatus Tariuqbacter arcticus]